MLSSWGVLAALGVGGVLVVERTPLQAGVSSIAIAVAVGVSGGIIHFGVIRTVALPNLTQLLRLVHMKTHLPTATPCNQTSHCSNIFPRYMVWGNRSPSAVRCQPDQNKVSIAPLWGRLALVSPQP